jgi:hypothetical protein
MRCCDGPTRAKMAPARLRKINQKEEASSVLLTALSIEGQVILFVVCLLTLWLSDRNGPAA